MCANVPKGGGSADQQQNKDNSYNLFYLGYTREIDREIDRDGLIEIFLSVCGSSAPAPSCWDERRWQTSCAAAAVLLAEWRECGFCITACLHLNPSMALTTALANSFRLRVYLSIYPTRSQAAVAPVPVVGGSTTSRAGPKRDHAGRPTSGYTLRLTTWFTAVV